MKCPMIRHFEDTVDSGPAIVPADCLEGECAWWVDDIARCAIRDIALELITIELRLRGIGERLEHLNNPRL